MLDDLNKLDAILKEANTMSDSPYFQPEDVHAGFKKAADECSQHRLQFERLLLGGLRADELPTYPSIPKPVMDGQTYAFPVYNTLSRQHIANLHHVAAGGIFHFIEREDLTTRDSRCIL